MTRQYAVTIRAEATELSPEILAQRLADLLGREVREVEEAVREDRVILGRDLRYAEAIEIQRELSRRQIPAQVTASQELTGRELWLRNTDSDEEAVPEQNVGERDIPSEKSDLDSGNTKEAESQGAEVEDGSAWSELFPDLADSPPDEAEEPTSVQNVDWEEHVVDPGSDETSSQEALLPELEALDDESEPMDVGEIELEPPSLPGGNDGSSNADDAGWMATDAVGLDAAGVEQEQVDDIFSESPSRPADDQSSGGFDAQKIHEAFSSDEERPPHEPKGYDPRPDHVPLFSALLSLFAPGAGQVLNGQPEKAQRYAVTFFLIYPWVKSVRQALEYGEKIRTYYAPRPPEGTGRKALVFAMKWWVAAGISVAVLWTMGSMFADHLDHREQQRQARVFQELVFYGQDTVVDAVSDGRRAEKVAAEAYDEEQARKEEEARRRAYTMEEEERARRLFIIAYHHCGGGNYETCQQLMSRVTSIVPGNRDAFRLQAWASMQQRERDRSEPMPEIEATVPTLEEFERELESQGESIEDVDAEFGDWWNDTGQTGEAGEISSTGSEGEYGEWWDDWLEDEAGEEPDEEQTSNDEDEDTAN